MATYTDGKPYRGGLKSGQLWIKGKTEREIISFNSETMTYRSKKDIREGTETTVPRSTFRRWLTSGAQLKDFPVMNCGSCNEEVYLKYHINKCACGARLKVLSK